MPHADDEGNYRARVATHHDAAVIARQRAMIFYDMGSIGLEDGVALRSAAEPYMRRLLEAGEYVGWMIESGEEIVGGGGIFLRELGPVPDCYRVGRWGHIANLYVEREHRRRGVARQLMKLMLDWCVENTIDRVTLAASDEGRALYESLGFSPTTEMQWSRGRKQAELPVEA